MFRILERFPDEQSCFTFLEQLRWGDDPACPLCGSVDVASKRDGDRVGRWNCHDCRSSFNVLSGTIFEKTRIPLRKWFCAISLMIDARKGVSSFQLARDLNVAQKTAWSMQHRIRQAMLDSEQEVVLQGIVEADETYVGGKPRHEPGVSVKRGRGTDKTPVIGVVERGGKVVAQVAQDVSGATIGRFIRRTVDAVDSTLLTDQFRSYHSVRSFIRHIAVNHRLGWGQGNIHTNTIEGFWAGVKRAWYGTHHHYSREWMPLFIAEACWKYNHRKSADAFAVFMAGCVA